MAINPLDSIRQHRSQLDTQPSSTPAPTATETESPSSTPAKPEDRYDDASLRCTLLMVHGPKQGSLKGAIPSPPLGTKSKPEWGQAGKLTVDPAIGERGLGHTVDAKTTPRRTESARGDHRTAPSLSAAERRERRRVHSSEEGLGFRYGSSSVDPVRAQAWLKSLTPDQRAQLKHPAGSITVVGSASGTGRASANRRLAVERAQRFVDWLREYAGMRCQVSITTRLDKPSKHDNAASRMATVSFGLGVGTHVKKTRADRITKSAKLSPGERALLADLKSAGFKTLPYVPILSGSQASDPNPSINYLKLQSLGSAKIGKVMSLMNKLGAREARRQLGESAYKGLRAALAFQLYASMRNTMLRKLARAEQAIQTLQKPGIAVQAWSKLPNAKARQRFCQGLGIPSNQARKLAQSSKLPSEVREQLATTAKNLARGKAKLEGLDNYAKLLSLHGIAGNVKSALVARYRNGSVTADAFKKAAADAVSIKSEDELMGTLGSIITTFLPAPVGTFFTVITAINDIKNAKDRRDIAKAGALAGATSKDQGKQAEKHLTGAVKKGVKDLLFAKIGSKAFKAASKGLRLPEKVGSAANTLLGSKRQSLEDKLKDLASRR